jgi:coproporphyrinogen III oxidase-like Fe-S oxidoreductase
MVYDEKYTDINKVHTAFNKLAPTLKFTIETENDKAINFLDIAIKHKENRLEFNVQRKPTATDAIIHKDSCHPPEQKQVAIIHMVNRMNTYKLKDDDKQNEQQIIEQIAVSNGFDMSVVKHINKPRQKRSDKNNKELWAKFTYFGKETRAITKLFKELLTNSTIRSTED